MEKKNKFPFVDSLLSSDIEKPLIWRRKVWGIMFRFGVLSLDGTVIFVDGWEGVQVSEMHLTIRRLGPSVKLILPKA